MVMHARGIEHHTNGVNNVLSYINLVLATGKIGAPGRGYGTITGQGNGQGGREHGQKADQLPGQRSITNPEHRKHVCEVWELPEEELPQGGRLGRRDVRRRCAKVRFAACSRSATT